MTKRTGKAKRADRKKARDWIEQKLADMRVADGAKPSPDRQEELKREPDAGKDKNL